MRAHILQHAAFEGPGSIAPWLAAAGYALDCTRLFEGADLPDPEAVDFLVAMGGPMSVNDEPAYPWLAAEKAFIRRVAASGRPVLGICLGAQLIAAAMGARVFPNAAKEIGWFPVRAEAPAEPPPFPLLRFPPEMIAFHWHGETFDLPPGAVRLASSAACRNQAFQLGPAALGLQFHLETTPETLRELVDHCRAELVPAAHVQSAARILAAPAAAFRELNRRMEAVLAFLHAAGGRG
jgi:GMP synthase-like glutamine amidotransferase